MITNSATAPATARCGGISAVWLFRAGKKHNLKKQVNGLAPAVGADARTLIFRNTIHHVESWAIVLSQLFWSKTHKKKIVSAYVVAEVLYISDQVFPYLEFLDLIDKRDNRQPPPNSVER